MVGAGCIRSRSRPGEDYRRPIRINLTWQGYLDFLQREGSFVASREIIVRNLGTGQAEDLGRGCVQTQCYPVTDPRNVTSDEVP